jgi:hypothetical protein
MKVEEINDIQLDLSRIHPLIGSKWRHYKGDIYKVLLKAVESNEPHRIKVIYQSESLGYIWEHPLDEWNLMVELEDGSFVQRFSPCYISANLERQWDC